MRAILTVIGEDKVGIIAMVSNALADVQANILDINQTVMKDIFSMTMLVDIRNLSVTFGELTKLLDQKGTDMGLSIRVQREEIFTSMNRI